MRLEEKMDGSDKVEAVRAEVLTLREFCTRNRISKSTYLKLRNTGRGPREMKLGGFIRISLDAESDWRKAREMPSDTEARLIAREAKHRQEVNRRNGRKSAASPKHISKKRRIVGGAR